MTTFQAHIPPYLDPMVPEDHMELSPAPVVDDDIDIDLDLDAAPVHDQDNDYIIEDARSDNTAEHLAAPAEVANDDVMLDEERAPADALLEDVDYHEEEVYDADYSITEPPLPSNDQSLEVEGYTQDTTINSDDNAPISSSSIGPVAPITADEAQESVDLTHSLSTGPTNPAVDTTELTHSPHDNEIPELNEQVPEKDNSTHSKAGSTVHSPKQAAPLNETTSSEAPTTKPDNIEADDDALTDTYDDADADENYDNQDGVAQIHPVVVIYEGSEISLFPPSKNDPSDTFFLPDESLALRNLCDMFEAIRSVLGGSINEDDELDIAIEGLGLQISEDSVHTRATTLYQILTLHVQLLHQDGVVDPDPLYMTLTTRVRFSKKLNDIISAAAEGRGISQLSFWDGEVREQGNADYHVEDTDYGEGNEIHSGSEAADASSEVATSPAEDSDNIHNIGSGSTKASPVGSAEDSHQDSKNEASPNNQEEAEDTNTGASNRSVVDEASLPGDIPDIGRSHDNASEQPHAVDEQNSREHLHDDAPEEASTTPEDDELHEDDLIDYDDDEEDDIKQQTSTGSSTVQDDDRRASGTLGYFVQPECFRPAGCFCADCIIRTETENATIQGASSRRSSTGQSSQEIPNEDPQDAVQAADIHEGYALEAGVDGEVEYYDQYNEEENYEDNTRPEGDADYGHAELYGHTEQYGDGTGSNDYLGYQESVENEFTVNESGEWNSGPWNVEGHTQVEFHENEDKYVQPQEFHGEEISAGEGNYDETVQEGAHLELLFDENAEEDGKDATQSESFEASNGFHHDVFGAIPSTVGQEPGDIGSTANGKHEVSGGHLDMFSDTGFSGHQNGGEAESYQDAEGDELYDDDILNDSLDNGDDSAAVNSIDRAEAQSPASHISAKRTHGEIEDGAVRESSEHDIKRVRSG